MIIALTGFSLFTIASLQALMMAVLERRLRQGPLPAFLQSLPPLLTMERLLFRIIAAGFVLLTLTLASGMLFSEELFGKPLRFTHKVVFAIAAWFIFAALLAGRQDLRLARTRGAALDAGRIHGTGARLHRHQVRARSPAGR